MMNLKELVSKKSSLIGKIETTSIIEKDIEKNEAVKTIGNAVFSE